MSLRQDNVTTDADQRLVNILTATANETGDMADLVRWSILNLQHARKALKRIERASFEPILGVAREGLELVGDE